MNEDLKNNEVLLVREKGKNELQIASTDKDGKIRRTKHVVGQNPDLVRVDKNGSFLENFFANFMRQVKEPTRFEFFRVPAERFNEVVQKLQEAFKNPDKPENKALLDSHRVDSESISKKQSILPIDETRIDWSQFERIGVSRQMLERKGNMNRLLKWGKTYLLPIAMKFEDTTVRTDARLALREKPDGTLAVSIHAIRREPELKTPYYGVRFTDEDVKSLLLRGNLGRIAEAEFTKGTKTPVFISLDPLTNEIISVRADRVNIPETIKGAQLSEFQRSELAAGKSVRVEGMDTDGYKYSAELQYSANKRGLDFFFKNDPRQSEVPKKFRSKELTEDQRNSLDEGKTVHIDGLVDKKGKMYNGYITLIKSSWGIEFMFPKEYKAALAANLVIPDDRHKTQVAVNSDGKTTEATKKMADPLEKGQARPTEKQAEKQSAAQEREEPKKSRGMKM